MLLIKGLKPDVKQTELGKQNKLLQMQQLDPALYELLEMIGFAGTPMAEVAALREACRRTRLGRSMVAEPLMKNF